MSILKTAAFIALEVYSISKARFAAQESYITGFVDLRYVIYEVCHGNAVHGPFNGVIHRFWTFSKLAALESMYALAATQLTKT